MASVRFADGIEQSPQATLYEWSDDPANARAAANLFRRLDNGGVGWVDQASVLALWPALSRYIDGMNAAAIVAQLQENTALIGRHEWMSLMGALRSITGARRFRSTLRGAEALLAEQRAGALQPLIVPHRQQLPIPGAVMRSEAEVGGPAYPRGVTVPKELKVHFERREAELEELRQQIVALEEREAGALAGQDANEAEIRDLRAEIASLQAQARQKSKEKAARRQSAQLLREQVEQLRQETQELAEKRDEDLKALAMQRDDEIRALLEAKDAEVDRLEKSIAQLQESGARPADLRSDEERLRSVELEEKAMNAEQKLQEVMSLTAARDAELNALVQAKDAELAHLREQLLNLQSDAEELGVEMPGASTQGAVALDEFLSELADINKGEVEAAVHQQEAEVQALVESKDIEIRKAQEQIDGLLARMRSMSKVKREEHAAEMLSVQQSEAEKQRLWEEQIRAEELDRRLEAEEQARVEERAKWQSAEEEAKRKLDEVLSLTQARDAELNSLVAAKNNKINELKQTLASLSQDDSGEREVSSLRAARDAAITAAYQAKMEEIAKLQAQVAQQDAVLGGSEEDKRKRHELDKELEEILALTSDRDAHVSALVASKNQEIAQLRKHVKPDTKDSSPGAETCSIPDVLRAEIKEVQSKTQRNQASTAEQSLEVKKLIALFQSKDAEIAWLKQHVGSHRPSIEDLRSSALTILMEANADGRLDAALEMVRSTGGSDDEVCRRLYNVLIMANTDGRLQSIIQALSQEADKQEEGQCSATTPLAKDDSSDEHLMLRRTMMEVLFEACNDGRLESALGEAKASEAAKAPIRMAGIGDALNVILNMTRDRDAKMENLFACQNREILALTQGSLESKDKAEAGAKAEAPQIESRSIEPDVEQVRLVEERVRAEEERKRKAVEDQAKLEMEEKHKAAEAAEAAKADAVRQLQEIMDMTVTRDTELNALVAAKEDEIAQLKNQMAALKEDVLRAEVEEIKKKMEEDAHVSSSKREQEIQALVEAKDNSIKQLQEQIAYMQALQEPAIPKDGESEEDAQARRHAMEMEAQQRLDNILAMTSERDAELNAMVASKAEEISDLKGKIASLESTTAKDKKVLTNLTCGVDAGSNVLQVEHVSGFSVGDTIRIGKELHVIAAFGSIILQSPLAHSYPPGTSITKIDEEDVEALVGARDAQLQAELGSRDQELEQLRARMAELEAERVSVQRQQHSEGDVPAEETEKRQQLELLQSEIEELRQKSSEDFNRLEADSKASKEEEIRLAVQSKDDEIKKLQERIDEVIAAKDSEIAKMAEYQAAEGDDKTRKLEELIRLEEEQKRQHVMEEVRAQEQEKRRQEQEETAKKMEEIVAKTNQRDSELNALVATKDSDIQQLKERVEKLEKHREEVEAEKRREEQRRQKAEKEALEAKRRLQEEARKREELAKSAKGRADVKEEAAPAEEQDTAAPEGAGDEEEECVEEVTFSAVRSGSKAEAETESQQTGKEPDEDLGGGDANEASQQVPPKSKRFSDAANQLRRAIRKKTTSSRNVTQVDDSDSDVDLVDAKDSGHGSEPVANNQAPDASVRTYADQAETAAIVYRYRMLIANRKAQKELGSDGAPPAEEPCPAQQPQIEEPPPPPAVVNPRPPSAGSVRSQGSLVPSNTALAVSRAEKPRGTDSLPELVPRPSSAPQADSAEQRPRSQSTTDLQALLQDEKDQHKRTMARLHHLERKLDDAHHALKRSKSPLKRFGVTPPTAYSAAPGDSTRLPKVVSPKNRRGGVYLPALRSLPSRQLRPGTSQRSQDEAAALAHAESVSNPSTMERMHSRQRSAARADAISKLESQGLNTWQLRKAEKVSKLQALDSFGDAMWDSFFSWKDDVDAVE